MADRPFFTNEAALNGQAAVSISIADPLAVPPTVGNIMLFDDTLTVTATTTLAEITAAEITLVGYTAGGYDLTGFSVPLFSPGSGAVATGNLINVAYASGAGTVCGGYAVLDSAGLVREVQIYDPPRPLQQVGNGWQIAVQLGYGANP